MVRCAHCRRVIPATVIRCPECGVHFQGEARDFASPEIRCEERKRKRLWMAAIAIMLVLAIILGWLL
jgi:hypothetical protein